MSSVNLARSLSVMACGAALLAVAPAFAEALVVRASGPSAGTFAPGKKLADGSSVTLKSGDVLTLLDGRGTRTLRGPGVFGTTTATAGVSSTTIASFIGTRTTSRSRTGAVRGGTGAVFEPRSPNVWYVDVRKPATMCVVDPTNVKLWRPKGPAGTLTIAGASGKGSVAFTADGAVADWPAQLPVTEGASYRLSGAGLASPVTVTFTVLAAGAEGLDSTASTLIARKCNAQLDLLIETVAAPDPTPEQPS